MGNHSSREKVEEMTKREKSQFLEIQIRPKLYRLLHRMSPNTIYMFSTDDNKISQSSLSDFQVKELLIKIDEFTNRQSNRALEIDWEMYLKYCNELWKILNERNVWRK